MNRQSAGKSFAYILGTYMGDGCITKEHGCLALKLEVMDEDFAQEFENSLKQLNAHNKFYRIENSRYKQGYSFHVVCRDKNLITVLLDDTKYKSMIPEYVFKWPGELKLAFIAGLMDSEGFVSKRSKIMKNGLLSYMLGIKMDFKILQQFKRLLQTMNIGSGKFTITKLKPGQKIQTANLTINIPSWIEANAYFNIRRKNDKIREYINNTNPNEYTLNT